MLNMVTETLQEYVFDGDGKPVRETYGFEVYHESNQNPPPISPEAKGFQIWSSVLDGQLTSLSPDGDLWNTKVYAGGTVIAEQFDGGNNWKTSDPVTGSEATYSSDGTGYVEEFSALGQKVSNLDPAEISDPPPNEVISFWVNMEWKCEVSKDFGEFESPMDLCPVKALEKKDKREDWKAKDIKPLKMVPDVNTPTKKPTLIDNTNETKEERRERRAQAEAEYAAQAASGNYDNEGELREDDWKRYIRVYDEARKGRASRTDLDWAKRFKATDLLSRIADANLDLLKTIALFKNHIQSFNLAYCHAAQESGIEQATETTGIVGPNGELGLFQIKLGTANEVAQRIYGYGFSEAQVRDNNKLNTFLATRHLQDLINSSSAVGRQAVREGLSAYNQGAGNQAKLGFTQVTELYADAVLLCESDLNEAVEN